MPISGLVLTISNDPQSGRDLLTSLERHPNITVGQCAGPRIAIATDTPDSESDKALWGWLESRPGVQFIDLVFAHFDEETNGSMGFQPVRKNFDQHGPEAHAPDATVHSHGLEAHAPGSGEHSHGLKAHAPGSGEQSHGLEAHAPGSGEHSHGLKAHAPGSDEREP